MSNEHDLELLELVDVDVLERIQNAFSNFTGMASITTDAEGIAVTKGFNFPEFCVKYVTDAELGFNRIGVPKANKMDGGLISDDCIAYHSRIGLVNFSAPIMAGDTLVGSFIGGQVLTEEPDYDRAREIALQMGVDPDEYVEALRKVKIVPRETVDKAVDFLHTITGVLSDITYSRYIAYQAGLEIERAANMKSDFLANMSHEIRTPMNAVIGMAEMALRENMTENARFYLHEIKAAGKSLLTIINDILDFSKIESGKMNIVEVEYEPMSILNDVTNIVITRLEDKDVELIVDIDPTLPNRLYGDNDRIKQVILNIVNNAVKFTKQGQVRIEVNYEKTLEDELLLKVAVVDTGIGIKKEDLSKLFESFQQLDSKRNRNIEGTGLGLSICKRLLTLMNGSIDVQSVYEEGSTFFIEIPQKIIDDKPSIFVNSHEPIHAAGLIDNRYVRAQIDKAVNKLGASFRSMCHEEELYLLPDLGISYLFVESALFSERVYQFAERNPDITVVLVMENSELIKEILPNVRAIRKPVYSLNIAMIFNNESVHETEGQDVELFDFVAPEAEILIVDDNAINLTVAEGLLEPLNMKIDTAASGKEAIDKITAKKYDIVFMDHMMPELDGVETTHIIRRFHHEYDAMPIIALTANAVDGTMEMFLKEGMNDFVAKPIELRLMISKIKRWLPAEKIQKNVAGARKATPKHQKQIKVGDLDVDSALKLLGSEKLFWSVLKDYYRVIEQKSSTIKSFEKEENWPAYTIEVHALKSASKQIGAHELSEKAAALEVAGNAKDSAFIHDKTDDLVAQYRSYIDVLKPYFTKESAGDTKKPAATKDQLSELFTQLDEAVDNLDMDQMEAVIEEMDKFGYEGAQAELFNKLREAVANIDVDSCQEILSEWRSQL